MKKVFAVCALGSLMASSGKAIRLESSSNGVGGSGGPTMESVSRLLGMIESTAEDWKESHLRTGKPLTEDPRKKMGEEKSAEKIRERRLSTSRVAAEELT